MVAQTFVSRHLYGYGTVLATIQTIFTTNGRRPSSNTRFYNRFGVDSMYMTTEGMEVQLGRGTRDSLTTWRRLPHKAPPPIRSLPPYTLTTLIIIPLWTDGLKRTG